MRGNKTRVVAVAAAVALTAGIGSAIAAESDGEPVVPEDEAVAGDAEEGVGDEDVPVAAGDEALVERLLEIEPDLPAPLPSAVERSSDLVDGMLTGSFTSSRSTLDSLQDQLRGLYVDGEEAGTAIGGAVSQVAHGLLLERQAMVILEDTDATTETRPLDLSDARDDDGNAIDADGLHGWETAGLEILFDARDLQHDGYETLSLAEVAGREVFADRAAQLVADRDGTGIALREVAAADSGQMLLEVERYDAPVGVAHARGVTFVCVDRKQYASLQGEPPSVRVAASVEVPDQACRDAARLAGLPLSEQILVDPLMEGVETEVGTG